MSCHGTKWRKKWRARTLYRSAGTGQSKEAKQLLKKQKARIKKGDVVFHAGLGRVAVVEEWGLFFACRNCHKPLEGPRARCCGDTQPLGVYGGGIFDVLCADGKTRSINKQWLLPVLALANNAESNHTPQDHLPSVNDSIGGEVRESDTVASHADRRLDSRGGRTLGAAVPASEAPAGESAGTAQAVPAIAA